MASPWPRRVCRVCGTLQPTVAGGRIAGQATPPRIGEHRSPVDPTRPCGGAGYLPRAGEGTP